MHIGKEECGVIFQGVHGRKSNRTTWRTYQEAWEEAGTWCHGQGGLKRPKLKKQVNVRWPTNSHQEGCSHTQRTGNTIFTQLFILSFECILDSTVQQSLFRNFLRKQLSAMFNIITFFKKPLKVFLLSTSHVAFVPSLQNTFRLFSKEMQKEKKQRRYCHFSNS